MNLLFGIHCHQPYNNFFEVIQEATDKAYYPFLKVLSKYPNIKISVHYSGWLLQWIKEYRKEVFDLIKKLVENNQIEIFTAGFYEPIIASIPEKDAELQIKKLNDFIYDNFGINPEGLWLTERVWDSKIVKVLVNCGIKYVIVDDYHFIIAGLNKKNLQGYFLTEEEGNSIGIFPISKDLRYLIPFKPVEDCIKFFQQINTGIIFDDGEKFGLWPHTYPWIYEKNWLNNFFTEISENNNINTLTFKDFFYNNKPIGRVYLPIASYFEMGEWSLDYESGKEFNKYFELIKNKKEIPEDVLEKFFKGGIWKNFLIKYEESNNIHKKMLKISKKLKNKNLNDELTDWLLKAQCNDCLWHGIFGGIYLPNLRNNSYIALNRIEKLLQEKYEKFYDFNYDGYGEFEIKNEYLVGVISEKYGAQLFELSDLDTGFNIGNTLTRRKEIYHDEILNSDIDNEKSEDEEIATIHEMKYKVTQEIKESLIFDNYLKYSFIDLFFDKYEKFDTFLQGKLNSLGNFHKEFQFDPHKKEFFKNGEINLFNRNFPVKIVKKYFLDKNNLICEYLIENNSFLYFDLFHGIELNLFFSGAENKKSYIEILNNRFNVMTNIQITKFLSLFEVFDNVIQKVITIKSDEKFLLWSYPFYSISKSEKSYEKTYQGSTFLLKFPFIIEPKQKIKRKIEISVGKK